MAKRRNKPLRIAVPLVLVALGVVLSLSFFTTTTKPTPEQQDAPTTDQQSAATPRDSAPSDTTPSPTPAQDSQPEPADTASAQPPDLSSGDADESGPDPAPDQLADPDTPDLLDGLRARIWPDPEGDRARRFHHLQDTLGGLDPDGEHRMLVEFSRYGAGIARLTLARYFETTTRQEHILIQREVEYEPEATGVTPFSIDVVTVGQASVRLQAIPDQAGIESRIWAPAPTQDPSTERAFIAVVENADALPILRIIRTYRLRPDSYELTVDHTIENLTGRTIQARLRSFGPVELPRIARYPGDRRRVRHGYLLSPERDPEQRWVQASGLPSRQNVLDQARVSKNPPRYDPLTPYWPTETSTDNGWTLVWLAHTNRYFTVAIHDAAVDDPSSGKRLRAAESVDRFVLNRANTEAQPAVLGFRMTGEPIDIAPGSAADLGVTLYAGPKSKRIIARHEPAREAGLAELVVYNIGGMCSFCTFSWLSGLLIGVMRLLHDHLVFDWALAIIFLVLIVRTVLHPVTKWSQIRVQRFGKQMQEIAPKQKKIQERYPDDRKKQQEEMAKLWREEGINPAGMLGCLPMFLQMPIWIALYATLYYAFELRQAGAFFGVFQNLFNGWAFLGDLSEPDRFIDFGGGGIAIPLLSAIQGPLSSINVLPLVMAVVLFLHQKYLTPPPSPSMTPEQKQQQKIIKVMTVVMLPVFMYNAPSGLSLYFVANSTLGIIENRWIRNHIDKHDLLNIDKLKAQRKSRPPLMQRLQQMAEQKQRQRQKYQASAQRHAAPSSRGRTRDSGEGKNRYKKRR